MLLDLLPKPIQIIYCKMQKALSIRGFFDALRELLDELEWSESTKKTFEFFANQYKTQEQRDQKKFEESILWINTQLKGIKRKPWKSESLKHKILAELSQKEQVILEGRSIFPTYFFSKLTLLEQIAKVIASYGEFDVLAGLGSTQELSVSLPLNSDPLKTPVEESKVVMPQTEEGALIIEALKNGFIRAKVLPPTKECKANRYFIYQGMILFERPEVIKRMLAISLEDWRTAFDLSAARCLHYLFCFADWKDWIALDLKLPEQPTDNNLNVYYNRMTMRNLLSNIFRGMDEANIRIEATLILDRFLAVFMQEQGEIKGKHNNKDKADKYVYIIVKSILLSKTLEERKAFTNEKVVSMVMDRIVEEDLSFNVTKTNCLEACKMFERKWGWPKKRGPDKAKGRAKGSNTRQKEP